MVKKVLAILLITFLFFCSKKDERRILYQGLYSENITSLDPARVHNKSTRQILPQIYETLLDYDYESKTFIPALAETYEVNENHTCYIFKLRNNVFFHDGSALDSEDVIYSFRRIFDETFILYVQEKNNFFHNDLSNTIDMIKEIDSLTVSFRLKYPLSNFLNIIASPDYTSIVSAENVKTHWGNIDRNPSGTGPFYFKEWTQNQEIILEKFSGYRGEQPVVDEIRFVLRDDGDELESLILKDSIDVLNYISATKIDLFLSKEKLNLISNPPVTTALLGFNLNVEPFDNKNIRKAVLHAIDVSRYTSAVERTNAILPLGPLPPSLFNYNNNEFTSHYDLRKALDLISGSQLPEIIKTGILVYGESNKAGVPPRFIAAFLKEIGIDLDIEVCFNLKDFQNRLKSNKFGMFILKWSNPVPDDPVSFLKSLFYTTSENNYFNFSNKEFDSLIDESLNTFNNNERNKLLSKAINIITEEQPAVFLNHIKEIIITDITIKSVPVSPLGYIIYKNLEL